MSWSNPIDIHTLELVLDSTTFNRQMLSASGHFTHSLLNLHDTQEHKSILATWSPLALDAPIPHGFSINEEMCTVFLPLLIQHNFTARRQQWQWGREQIQWRSVCGRVWSDLCAWLTLGEPKERGKKAHVHAMYWGICGLLYISAF